MTNQKLNEAVTRYMNGIKNNPKGFKTTLDGIKSFRILNDASVSHAKTEKAFNKYNSICAFFDDQFNWREKSINVKEFIEILNAKLIEESISI